MSELGHPFTEVGLDSLDTTRFQIVIQLCFFAHHGLGFDNQVNALALAQFVNIAIGVLRCACLVNDCSRSFCLRFELGN